MKKSESKYFNTAKKMDIALIELLNKKDFEYITIKEICEYAKVNRSTFYLHYENMRDLLEESIEYANCQMMSYYQKGADSFMVQISDIKRENLVLTTREYLIPYLSFIKDNRMLFCATLRYPEIMGATKRYEWLRTNIVFPILGRFDIQPDRMEYMMQFYINGIIAIVQTWLKSGCSESLEKIAEIIEKCVCPEIKK
ncbi:MAG: TetR/AcrR family transcriptional regulator [Clostridiales bacterium]|nr:TetR/AcrR family transcriptional regulator [Clostridiales bacterium]